MKGLDLHRAFFEECGKPLLRRRFPKELSKIAVASVGFGSDRIGADDEISRDHCWEPGFQLFSQRLVPERLASIERTLYEELPWEFRGFKRSDTPHFVNGIRAWTIDEFFEFMTGFARPPVDDTTWLRILETDLFCATNGEVFYDPTDDLSKRRQDFRYYPENVWRSKLGGRAWRILTLRLSAQRALAHGETITAEMLISEGIRETMHFGFLVNKQYAPYDRWLHWAFRRLPELATSVESLIRQIWDQRDCEERIRLFGEIESCCAQHIYEKGMVATPETWCNGLRGSVTGDLAREPFSATPFWVGTEFRYGSLSAIGGDIRKLYR